MTDQPTYNNLVRRADKPYRIISDPQHTLTMDRNRFLYTISISRTLRALSDSTNAGIDSEGNGIEGDEESIENEDHEARKGGDLQSERCVAGDTNTYMQDG